MVKDPKQPFVSVSNLHKSFAGVPVLRGVDLDIFPGELVSLLGVNGAGKTTMINIMLGLEQADKGRVILFGDSPKRLWVHRKVGVTPQSSGFPEYVTVKEVIEFVRSHYLSTVPIIELARRFDLTALLERKAMSLSGGQKRLLAVALAFIGDPQCVFLDEPTTGLDVESRRVIWRVIREYLKLGGSVFLTTHYLEEAEALSTRVVVLADGRIKYQGSVTDIKLLAGLARVCFRATDVPQGLPTVEKMEQEDGRVVLHTHDTDQLIRELVKHQVLFKDLKITASSFEQAYLNMTRETDG